MRPLVCVTCPVPPQTSQSCGAPTAPDPPQVAQVSRRVMVSFLTVPRTASQKLISIRYSRSEPGSLSLNARLDRHRRGKIG